MLAWMPAPRPHRRTAALVAVLVGSLSILLAYPARGQTPAEQAISLELAGQPVWHGSDDPLGLRVRVANEGLSTLSGFRLQVRAYPPATSRSELHQNFEVDPLRIEHSSLPVDRLELDIPAGTHVDVEVDAPLAGLTSILAGPPGVYPVTVTVTDADGSTALDSVTTQLLYFPEDVEVPLNVVVLWPLVDLPSRQKGGVFVSEEGTTRLEAATGSAGWLTGTLDAFEAPFARALRLGIAPGPRLVEELADMADGFRSSDGDTTETVAANDPAAEAAQDVLERVRDLLARDRIQPVLTPYGFPDLTAVEDFERLTAQLTAAQSVLDERLEPIADPGWLFAPAGRLDEVTLERLRASDAAASTFFSADSLEPESTELDLMCRQDFVGIAYTCPVKVTTPTGNARGFVLDAEIQQRFGSLVAAPGDVREMQKLFAEIAMVYLELPGTAERVLPLAVPPLWHPTAAISARFVRTLAQGPWIRPRTPLGGLGLGIGNIRRDLVNDAPRSPVQPEAPYMEDIDEAATVVESYARLRPPISLVQRLRRDVLIGQSLLWWSEDPARVTRGAAFAADARTEAEIEFEKISIAGRRDITLASRRGTLPLSLQNGTDYPVTLEVHLQTSDRDLDLSDTLVTQTFEPGATALPVQVSARASGIYPVRIRVQSSDGFEISETSISVRSTEFNEIALAITLGALAFLVLFSAARGVRRRRASAGENETPSK